MEDHVQAVNKILREAQEAGTEELDGEAGSGEEEWDGIHDDAQIAPVDLEEEYIDEDRYTTVTIESVTVDRDGLHKPEPETHEQEGEEEGDGQDEEEGEDKAKMSAGAGKGSSKPRKERPKKKKFRYESKFERQLTERKRKAKARR